MAGNVVAVPPFQAEEDQLLDHDAMVSLRVVRDGGSPWLPMWKEWMLWCSWKLGCSKSVLGEWKSKPTRQL